jgi:hypothetical protein
MKLPNKQQLSGLSKTTGKLFDESGNLIEPMKNVVIGLRIICQGIKQIVDIHKGRN